MNKSLFICYTPLHAIITKRIIDIENIRRYSVIFLCSVENKKHRYYYDSISNEAESSSYAIMTKNPIKDIVFLTRFIYNLRRLGFDNNTTVYTGNIKTIYSRIVAYFLNSTNYVTFDDGTGNISGNGYFYSDDNLIKNIIFKIFAPHLQYNKIRDSHHKHYTIFKLPNAYSNASYLQLFTPSDTPNSNKILSILLTNPFSEDCEMDRIIEERVYKEIVTKYGIDLILPHPREKQKKVKASQAEYIETQLVAEDYINTLSKQYLVTVYGIYSTALLTLNNIHNVKLINIDVQLKKPTNWLRNVFQKENIPTEPLHLNYNRSTGHT